MIRVLIKDGNTIRHGEVLGGVVGQYGPEVFLREKSSSGEYFTFPTAYTLKNGVAFYMGIPTRTCFQRWEQTPEGGTFKYDKRTHRKMTLQEAEDLVRANGRDKNGAFSFVWELPFGLLMG